ncbi:MAG: hypothetical protein GY869_27645, partial [Planctomycetes bacterium]|nr:hypothetical protein [Planctomycetota bacterium]
MIFELYDALTGGSQVGSTLTRNNRNVYDGYFTVNLDFGSLAFNGNARWLQIGVRPFDSVGSYTILSPRQELKAAPYAIWAKLAENVVGGTGVGGSGTANYIPKFLDPTTLGNSIIVESSGNVGIGDSTPDYPLDVTGTIFSSGDLIVSGGDIIDPSGNLRISGEDNVYINMDHNNNDANTRAIIFGKNNTS